MLTSRPCASAPLTPPPSPARPSGRDSTTCTASPGLALKTFTFLVVVFCSTDGRYNRCDRAGQERAPGLVLTSMQQCRVSAPKAEHGTTAATAGHCRSSSRRKARETSLRQNEGQPCRAIAGGAARCFGCLAADRGHDVAAVRRGELRRTFRLRPLAQLSVLGTNRPHAAAGRRHPNRHLSGFRLRRCKLFSRRATILRKRDVDQVGPAASSVLAVSM